MDKELLIWVLVFVGGYSLVVGYLLKVALANRGDPGPTAPGDGEPTGGSGPEGPMGGPSDPRSTTPPGGGDGPPSSHPTA
jgi:hypothetical protein